MTKNEYIKFLKENKFPGFQRADIIVTSSNSLLSKLIRWGERIGEEEKSVVSHIELYAFNGFTISQDWECRFQPLTDHFNGREKVWLIKPLALSDESRNAVLAEAVKDTIAGKEYDTTQILGFLFYKLTSWKKLKQLVQVPKKEVCSTAVMKWYKKTNIFNELPKIAAPDDFWDYIHSNPVFLITKFSVIKIWDYKGIDFEKVIKELIKEKKNK